MSASRIITSVHVAYLGKDGKQVDLYTGDELPADAPKEIVEAEKAAAVERREALQALGLPFDAESSDDEEVVQEPMPEDYSDSAKWPVEKLQELATERSLEVAGTGKDGNVVRGDLEKALTEHDAAQA